ncbi:hypothetical protein SYJ56_22595 [Algoriphagus sp. D3-2-R+10]|uniref:hypothetical protein n=1 Tax=Algoriphagus aurantiacus TaxID=3103948 RepID=UPI002B3C34FF|nr:hypothetical protein [Algoriphagus sp. D3-2-R+10]MEB2778119.1 hypothetical protein [Algoriphagus sp. D3-2-R+10]
MQTLIKKVATVAGMTVMVLFFNMNLSMGYMCDTFYESSGARVTVCDDIDGTTTFYVFSSETGTPGACAGSASDCDYVYTI